MNATTDSAPVLASEPAEEAEPPERCEIVLIEEAGDWSEFPAREELVANVAAIMVKYASCARLRGRDANVVLADNELVRSLNRTYRGKDGATNVLSFSFVSPSGSEETAHLGDVVLALETVVREATEQSIPPAHHFQHLVVHGLLHLIGFDHEAEPDAVEMEQLETRILAALAIPDPHALTQSD
jgi:probable rRNA maturation factor